MPVDALQSTHQNSHPGASWLTYSPNGKTGRAAGGRAGLPDEERRSAGGGRAGLPIGRRRLSTLAILALSISGFEMRILFGLR